MGRGLVKGCTDTSSKVLERPVMTSMMMVCKSSRYQHRLLDLILPCSDFIRGIVRAF